MAEAGTTKRRDAPQMRTRVAIWLLVASGAVLGVLVAMLLVYVVLGGSIGLGL